MATLRVRINMDGNAFAVQPRAEILSLIAAVARRISEGEGEDRVIDTNGNTCGECAVTEEEA